MKEREQLGSRLGFILLSAGCAIGIGNVWKFPWLVGQNGGGAFVLVYLLFLAIMGVPVMTMEFAMGRASQASPVTMYRKLEPGGSFWHLHGYAAVAGNYIIMMFYTSVCGWMIQYFFTTAAGIFTGLDTDGVAAEFANMMASPVRQWGFMAVSVIAGFFILSMGLQQGVERITKFMMTALILIMLILAFNSILAPGGSEGLSFYLKPDFAKLREAGLWNVVQSAMNQAFFTLSVGMGGMAIFGSYIGKDHSLMGESVNVALLDTFVALTSGLIIFPACFAYGVEPDAGPSLIFITLPNIFNHMGLGRLWGSLFFVFMSFAAMSTVIGVFENIIAMFRDLTGMSRKKACLVNTFLMLVLATPCALAPNLLAGIQPMGPGTSIMDLEDFLVSNLILPLGAFIFCIFCTRKIGWGWDNFVKEANTGKGMKVASWMRFYLTWILPFLFLIVFVMGIRSYL